jgi:hypothetical protein
VSSKKSYGFIFCNKAIQFFLCVYKVQNPCAILANILCCVNATVIGHRKLKDIMH